MRMIIGLGNPGKVYAGTRHNVGFDVIDLLARRLGAEVKKKKFGGLVGQVGFEDKKLILLKPLTYMNNSGQVTATAKGFFKIDTDAILVITDDMALEPGTIRIRAKGSAGSHNGLGDIIEKLGGGEFARLRVGIGKSDREVGSDYVLAKPGTADAELIAKACERAAEAALVWATAGVQKAMNEFNAK